MKKLILGLFVLALFAGSAWAQTPTAGWNVFVIREGSTEAPFILDASGTHGPGAIEVGTTEGGQKVGLATNGLNGATVGQIGSLHIDRLDNIAASGSLYGPYFNIWVTDGLGNYAVIANEPSNAEWGGNQWDITDWDFLKTKSCKVYETPGAGTGTSWLHVLIGNPGPLVFDDVKDLIIEPPSTAYITNPANAVGSGAPDEILTNIAYGYTWVFGDTAANYVSGGDGFIVANYTYTVTFPVNNVTQGLGYSTIGAALAAANPYDAITVAAGTYTETLNITVEGVSITGDDQATVIIDPTGLATNNAGVYVAADNVALSTLTIDATATNSLPRYGLKIGAFDGCSVVDVTAKECYRSGFDFLDSSNLTLTGLTSVDNGGHGLSLVDCKTVAVTDFTAATNGWQNVSVATWGRYSVLGTSGIVFSGTNVFGELFQLEMGDYNNPGVAPAGDAVITYSTDILDGADVTVQSSDFMYAIHGDQDDSPDQVRIWFMFDLANAALVPAAAPAGHWAGTNMYIENLVDGSQLYVTPGCSIKAAIAASPVGGTVNVAGGTYVEDGQILVDHTVSVIGDPGDRAVVMTNMNTGSSGDARGWFLHNGGHLVLQNLELDGTGFDVYQAIRSTGTGAMDNCAVRNIVFPGYAGVALAAFGNPGDWDVTGNTFDNIGRVGALLFGAGLTGSSFVDNVYTGKGAGDWLDYACDISAGAVVHVEGNTVTGNLGVASSDGSTSAALLVTTFFGAGTTATIDNNILTGNTTGVAAGYDASDVSVVSGSGNDFSGNASFGVSNSAANWVDFTGNWWGDASGPQHGTLNPAGTGVPVDDYVYFEPWVGLSTVAALPAATGPIPCGTPVTLTFNLTTDAYTPDVFGYNAVVRAPAGVDFGAINSLDPFGGTTTFFHYDNGDGSWTLSGTTTGTPSQPITTAGTHGLFTIVFTPTVEGVHDITFDLMQARDPVNAPIAVSATGATFTVDCTAPAAVTGIIADPAHNKINVSWTHDGTDVTTYEVYRGLWYDTNVGDSAYPEYDDEPGSTLPTRPADLADAIASGEWELAGSVAVGTNSLADTWADHSDRGVYYYEVFPVDAATNAGPVAAANDRATNYWLGDVTGTAIDFDPNGEVDAFDMNDLGAAFGLPVPHGTPTNVLDVGPTDDWSRLGIPTTDSVINFEDLMVFAMNFGVVSAAKADVTIGTSVDLAWISYDDGTMGLRLEGGKGLKGVRVVANAAVQDVRAGDLLDNQSELTFLENVGQKLDVSVAVMGVNKTFEGTGDLFVLSSESAIDMKDLTITARALDNSEMEISLESGSDAATPRVFALNGNYPNPFNPMTKISFSLPATHDVRLSVYAIDGRLVRTLVNETRGAGLHEVVWNGRDDAGRGVSSGTYFYRVEAGPYSDVKKMTLMK